MAVMLEREIAFSTENGEPRLVRFEFDPPARVAESEWVVRCRLFIDDACYSESAVGNDALQALTLAMLLLRSEANSLLRLDRPESPLRIGRQLFLMRRSRGGRR